MYPNFNSGLLKNSLQFLKNIDFPAILDGTSKTLGVINQAIPVYNQLRPIISNIGTISKISKAMNDTNNVESKTDNNKNNTNTSPLFFI